ncbi:MAG TPA: hypothetical protein VFY24_10215 [Azospira sp.]|nr:hypothetical protein [Azospira sp.]
MAMAEAGDRIAVAIAMPLPIDAAAYVGHRTDLPPASAYRATRALVMNQHATGRSLMQPFPGMTIPIVIPIAIVLALFVH